MPPVTNHSTAVLSHSKPAYSNIFCDSCHGWVRDVRYVLCIKFLYRICLLCSKRGEFSLYYFADSIFKFIQGSSGFIFNFPNVLFSGPRILSPYLFPTFLFSCFPYPLLISNLPLCRFSYVVWFIGTSLLLAEIPFHFFFRTFSYGALLCFLFSFCSPRHSEERASVLA